MIKMGTFLKLLYYKLYRLLEKYSKGDEMHCAYNAMLFTSLVLVFNIILLFFAAKTVLGLNIEPGILKVGTLIFLALTFIVSYGVFLKSNRYIQYVEEIKHSKWRGKLGSIMIASYIILSFLSLLTLVLYYLHKYGVF